METDPLKRIVTPSTINDHLLEKCKENTKLINILKTGKQFTVDDVEELSQLPRVR